MSIRETLAIDFGTANTYVCRCPATRRSPSGVDFGNGRDGLATAVLYRQQSSGKKLLVGHQAVNEYGDATAQERAGYSLRTHFKPELANGGEAFRNAVDFLRGILEDARNQRLDIDPTERHVIFGVPSEAGPAYREALADAARQAGYGDIDIVEEPIGALYYHIHHKGLAASDALRGLLVVDFGGGTCDFAFLRDGHVQHSWGDMRLGGRLFDDLFFQWLLDDNPGVLDVLRREGAEYYVHSCLCREVKEAFSLSVKRDRSERFSKPVRHYGRINNMSWESFVKRASSYSPSEVLRTFHTRSGGNAPFPEGPVDLISWFRDCLIGGLRSECIAGSEIKFVLLAGGSSLWPFVSDVLEADLGVESGSIRRSDRPYATIAEGISLQPAKQREFLEKQRELKEGLPQFRKEKLDPLLVSHIGRTAEDISEEIARDLFDAGLRPILAEFQRTGGAMASLKARCQSVLESYQPRAESLIREKTLLFTTGLSWEVVNLCRSWFAEHGLVLPNRDVPAGKIEVPSVGDISRDLPHLYGQIVENAACLASYCIFATPFFLAHPIAAIPLGILAFATLTYGAEKTRQVTENWNVPTLVARWTFSDRAIAKLRERLLAGMKSDLVRLLGDKHNEIAALAVELVECEIKALSDVNQLA